ncbi:Uma2 family endonuclease [Actinoallomurus vinaceus]|uniref:Uma2 family endonuclease n=1 Tax=Actinoallomurus vinaceus TaxID=1080074 RepID=UPI0031E76BF5
MAPEQPLPPRYLPSEGEPFTIHHLFQMPEDKVRYEVLEGTLLVSPWPAIRHQAVRDELRLRLKVSAPPKTKVFTDVTVRLKSDATAFVPDIVVIRPGVKLGDRGFLEAEDVLAVVEVVSPGSTGADRKFKPAIYAGAGIPYFWRVEPMRFRELLPGEQPPVVLVHELDEESGSYRLAERLAAGRKGRVTVPYPLEFDPADLLPQDD